MNIDFALNENAENLLLSADVTNFPGFVISPPIELVQPALPLKVMEG